MGGVGLELGGETVTLLTPQLQGVALAVTRGGLDSAQGPGGGARGGEGEGQGEGWEVRTYSVGTTKQVIKIMLSV